MSVLATLDNANGIYGTTDLGATWLWAEAMRSSAVSELPRIYLLRTPVKSREKKGTSNGSGGP